MFCFSKNANRRRLTSSGSGVDGCWPDSELWVRTFLVGLATEPPKLCPTPGITVGPGAVAAALGEVFGTETVDSSFGWSCVFFKGTCFSEKEGKYEVFSILYPLVV